MIKNLITASLLAATPLSANITGQLTDFTTIQTQPNLIQQETYNGDDLNIGEYYAIKVTNNQYLKIGETQIKVKGYQYTYVDATNESLYQIIDYYINTDVTLPYIFEYFEFLFNGNSYTVQNMQPYYEEYALQYKDATDIYVTAFFSTETPNFSLLNSLRTDNNWQNFSNANHDVYQNTAYLKANTKNKYYRFRIKYNFDAETYYAQAAIQSTAQIYETIRIQYSYTTITEDNRYEVVDIPGLMFSILGMPFAFISTAFNLTLFPGTPYAVNIAHIFMAIIGVLIIIAIIRIFTK